MRSAAAALIVFAGNVLAHPGHGAPEGHFHGWGVEHALLLAVVFGVLVFALRKK
jgi:hypothetical protein